MSYTGVLATFSALERAWLKNKLTGSGIGIQEQIDPGPERMTAFYSTKTRGVVQFTHTDKYAFTNAHIIDLDKEVQGPKIRAFIDLVRSLSFSPDRVGRLVRFNAFNPMVGENVYRVTKAEGIHQDRGEAVQADRPYSGPEKFDEKNPVRDLFVVEVLNYYKNRKKDAPELLLLALSDMIGQLQATKALTDDFQRIGRLDRGGIMSDFKDPKFHEPTLLRPITVPLMVPFPNIKVFTDCFRVPVELMGLSHGEPFVGYSIDQMFKHSPKPEYVMNNYTSKFWFVASNDGFRLIKNCLLGSAIVIPFQGKFEGKRRFLFENGVLSAIPQDMHDDDIDVPQIIGYDIAMIVAAMLLHKTEAVTRGQIVELTGYGVCVVVRTAVTEINGKPMRRGDNLALKRVKPGTLTSFEEELIIAPRKKVKVLEFKQLIERSGATLIKPKPKLSPEIENILLPLDDPKVDQLFYGLKDKLMGRLTHTYPGDILHRGANMNVETHNNENGFELRIQLSFDLKTKKSAKEVGPMGWPDYNAIGAKNSLLHDRLTEDIHKTLNEHYATEKKAAHFVGDTGVKVDRNIVTGVDRVTFDWPMVVRSNEAHVRLGASSNAIWVSGRMKDEVTQKLKESLGEGITFTPAFGIPTCDIKMTIKGQDLLLVIERVNKRRAEAKAKLDKSVAENKLLSKKEHDYNRIFALIDSLYPVLHDPKSTTKLDNKVIDELTDLLNSYSELYG